MSRPVISALVIWATIPTFTFAHGACASTHQAMMGQFPIPMFALKFHEMMQSTCRQQQPPEWETQRRMMMTTLLQKQREFQMTALLQRQREFQMTALLQQQREFQMTSLRQRLSQTTPVYQQRLMVPYIKVPSLVLTPPVQQGTLPQPLLRTATPLVPLNGSPAGLTTPVMKPSAPQQAVEKPRTEKPATPLVRTPDEQTKYSEAALQRGLIAEGEGNYVYARACYRTALTYPDSVPAQSARKTLKRVESLLEQFPALADATYFRTENAAEPTMRKAKSETKTPATPAPQPQVITSANATPAPSAAPEDTTRRNLHRLLNPPATRANLALPTAIANSP